ncbi:MAG: MFS transporter, partial [Bacteroidales bacterium]|nr:MFS transporter [Bacteroidales bacterium]
KNTKPLGTMIVGIALGTIGMGILGISTSAWVFIAGIVIFSIGEMTAHPKFISYVGLIAPADKKALYLGYSFLYGVIGSGVGGILGALLYVRFVNNMQRPDLLWFTFALIGVFTIVALLIYNWKFGVKKTEKQ